MAKDVRCSVTTCAYQDQNDCCKANEIRVSKCNCSSPCEEQETECGTFKLK